MNPSVKLAGLLMSCFAAFLVVEAIGFAMVQGRFDPHHFAVHVLGAIVWFLVARGLLQRRRWAWLAVVTFGSLMCLLVAMALLAAVVRGESLLYLARVAEVAVGLGRLGLPLGGLSLAALAGSVVLLLKKEARAAFSPRPKQG